MIINTLTAAYGVLNGYVQQPMERKVYFFGMMTPIALIKGLGSYSPRPGASPAAILVPFVAAPIVQGLFYTAGKQVGAGLKDARDLK